MSLNEFLSPANMQISIWHFSFWCLAANTNRLSCIKITLISQFNDVKGLNNLNVEVNARFWVPAGSVEVLDLQQKLPQILCIHVTSYEKVQHVSSRFSTAAENFTSEGKENYWTLLCLVYYRISKVEKWHYVIVIFPFFSLKLKIKITKFVFV